MRIKFKVAEEVTLEELEELVKTENIGWDPDCSSGALLMRDPQGQPVWVTAWSGFKYTLLKSEGGWSTWKYEGAENGFLAQNLIPDFLARADCLLLGERGARIRASSMEHGHPLPDVPSEIIEARGSYGVFHGSLALVQYSERKEARRAAA